MALPIPREGEAQGFHIHRTVSEEWTLGDPETLLWSSIRHMSVSEVADYVLREAHKITSESTRKKTINNLKLYVRHAFEFYDAAQGAKANTAPLFYYYCFLNLAKGLCEISRPRFHQKSECYAHGLTWSPNHDYVVRMPSEAVRVSRRRGVWHALWEAIQGRPCHVPAPVSLKVKELLSLNPETAKELKSIHEERPNLIRLVTPNIFFNEHRDRIWIQFSVLREEAKEFKLTRSRLLEMIVSGTSGYRQVQSANNDLWTFEFRNTKNAPYDPDRLPFELVEAEIKEMYPVAYATHKGLEYALPIQRRLPLRLPQIMVLYSLMFWLGSLVRYDPHSVADLQDSEYWMLIDAFMNQSRIWLLELFEWEFYKTETTLRLVR